jgi:hypothetical protein
MAGNFFGFSAGAAVGCYDVRIHINRLYNDQFVEVSDRVGLIRLAFERGEDLEALAAPWRLQSRLLGGFVGAMMGALLAIIVVAAWVGGRARNKAMNKGKYYGVVTALRAIGTGFAYIVVASNLWKSDRELDRAFFRLFITIFLASVLATIVGAIRGILHEQTLPDPQIASTPADSSRSPEGQAWDIRLHS